MRSAHYDVAIVGGGIAGCSLAHECRKAGAKVVLIEQHALGSAQTNHSLGFLSASSSNPTAIELGLGGIDRWKQLPEELGGDIGLNLSGNLTFPTTENGRLNLEKSRTSLAERGLETELVDASFRDISAMLPGLVGLEHSGVYFPHEGQVEPRLASAAFREALVAAGVDVIEGAEVVGAEISGSRVLSIRCGSQDIAAGRFAITAGAWTRTTLARFGVWLPIMKIRGFALETVPLEPLTPLAVMVGGWAMRQTPFDTLILSSISKSVHELSLDSVRLFDYFARARGRSGIARVRLNADLFKDLAASLTKRAELAGTSRVAEPRANRRIDALTMRQFERLSCRRSEGLLARSWGYVVDVTPDDLPLVGGVPGYDNLFVSTGFSGKGLTAAPYLSTLLVTRMLGDAQHTLLDRLRISRFMEKDYDAPVYRF